MKKHIKFINLISIPLVALALWVASIEYINHNAPRILLTATGYDPRDLLSGHYLQLRIDWDNSDMVQLKQIKTFKDIHQHFDNGYRFYLPEHDAVVLDNIIRNQRDLKLYLQFSVPPTGKALLLDLYIDGVQWKKWLNSERKSI